MRPPRHPAIWIIRHGERIDFVDPNWPGRDTEPFNPHLSPNGFVQARDVARRLRGEGLRHIIASPFRRAMQTADVIAEALDLPIKVERGACEMLSAKWFPRDPRDWSMAKLSAEFPRIDPAHVSVVDPAYPEEWEGCLARARLTIRGLVDRYGGDFLVVTHGAALAGLTWGLLDNRPDLNGGCCSLVRLASDDAGAWRLDLAGDRSHLTYLEPAVRFV